MERSDDPDRLVPDGDHIFVLRIRRGREAGAPIRATIRHLPSGSELSTADLTEIDDFVRLRAGDVA